MVSYSSCRREACQNRIFANAFRASRHKRGLFSAALHPVDSKNIPHSLLPYGKASNTLTITSFKSNFKDIFQILTVGISFNLGHYILLRTTNIYSQFALYS